MNSTLGVGTVPFRSVRYRNRFARPLDRGTGAPTGGAPGPVFKRRNNGLHSRKSGAMLAHVRISTSNAYRGIWGADAKSLGSLGAERGNPWGGIWGPGAANPGPACREDLGGNPLADGCDLCERCAAGFLNWMRGGNPHQADHGGPGGRCGYRRHFPRSHWSDRSSEAISGRQTKTASKGAGRPGRYVLRSVVCSSPLGKPESLAGRHGGAASLRKTASVQLGLGITLMMIR